MPCWPDETHCRNKVPSGPRTDPAPSVYGPTRTDQELETSRRPEPPMSQYSSHLQLATIIFCIAIRVNKKHASVARPIGRKVAEHIRKVSPNRCVGGQPRVAKARSGSTDLGCRPRANGCFPRFQGDYLRGNPGKLDWRDPGWRMKGKEIGEHSWEVTACPLQTICELARQAQGDVPTMQTAP